jgi:hypothetical protein
MIMLTTDMECSVLKNSARQEIHSQIEDFIARGGKIEQLPSNISTVKPVGPIWHNEKLEITSIN